MRVCGPVPAGAITPRVVAELSPETYVLRSPTGNLLCDLRVDRIACVAREYTFAPVPDPEPDRVAGEWRPNVLSVGQEEAQAGLLAGDPLIVEFALEPKYGGKATTLGYGKVAAIGPMACLSQEIGLSCWNAATTHGFFLSRGSYATW